MILIFKYFLNFVLEVYSIFHLQCSIMIINVFNSIIKILHRLAFRIEDTLPKTSVRNVVIISSNLWKHCWTIEWYTLRRGAVSLENVVRIEKKYSQLHSAWKMNSTPERHNSRIPLFLHSGLVESQRFASFSYRSSTTKFDFFSVSFLHFFSCISISRATGRWGTRRKLKRFSETFLPFLNLT